jgi:general secretion pathway protein G
MKKRNGFTLVEILIVVVILGILAAIVIPQFSDASTEAKNSSLASDLQTVRSQIQLYKIQHNGDLPGFTNGVANSVTFTDAMTKYTTVAGAVAATQAPASGVYGPYLQAIPKNPFDNSAAVAEGTTAAGSGAGWYFNTTTGAFQANDTAGHAAY